MPRNYYIKKKPADVGMLNGEISVVAERMEQASYTKNNITFLITVFTEDMLIDLEKVNPCPDDPARRYAEDFQREFGAEFGLDEEETEQDP
jgi:hypothetical protein